jgi:hypothetical protein
MAREYGVRIDDLWPAPEAARAARERRRRSTNWAASELNSLAAPTDQDEDHV